MHSSAQGRPVFFLGDGRDPLRRAVRANLADRLPARGRA
jgi:hypothetical protein